MSWRILSRAASLALAVAAIASAGAAPASALTLVPPKPEVLFGVSDRGTTQDFNEFAELLAKHPALLETFHPWGNSLNQAFERWRETSTRPILHISTQDDQTLAELITPEQIALGAGDDYLLQLNDFFSKRGLPAYIRPLGEPNRCLNAWSAVNCDGTPEGRRTHDRLVQAGIPPHRRDRARRPDAGRDQRDAGRNRPAAGQPHQRTAPDGPAGGAGEHRLEPAAGRLAAGEGQLPRAITGRAPAGSTGSAPTSTRSIRSGKTSITSTPANSGSASPSRSPSGPSRAKTIHASSSNSSPGPSSTPGSACSSTTTASAQAPKTPTT